MKASEKRLLFLMVGIALLGGGVIGANAYLDERDRLLKERERLQTEWQTFEDLFDEREMWEIRGNWLEANQPPYSDSVQVQDEIFKVAQAADVEGVETSNLSLVTLEEGAHPYYEQAGVSLTAKGRLPDVMRWAYDLSRPKSFQVIRNFSVEPDKEDPEDVLVKFDLLRWYAPNDPDSPAASSE